MLEEAVTYLCRPALMSPLPSFGRLWRAAPAAQLSKPEPLRGSARDAPSEPLPLAGAVEIRDLLVREHVAELTGHRVSLLVGLRLMQLRRPTVAKLIALRTDPRRQERSHFTSALRSLDSATWSRPTGRGVERDGGLVARTVGVGTRRRVPTCRVRGVGMLVGLVAVFAPASSQAMSSGVYVTDINGSSVFQLGLGAGGLLTALTPATVKSEAAPVGIAVSPDGKSVYVAAFDGGVSQYDVGAGGLLTAKTPAGVPAGTNPEWLAVSPDGKSVYVTNHNGANVSQYDVGAGGVLSPKSPPPCSPARIPLASW